MSTAGGRFPRAWLEPRANRMLVMKALRQDVAILAFHPHVAPRGLKAHGTALSFVPPKTFCYSRKCFRCGEQSQSQESPPSVPINDAVLRTRKDGISYSSDYKEAKTFMKYTLMNRNSKQPVDNSLC